MRAPATYQGNDMNKEFLNDVFRDAHVVDLDFSVWDHLVSMVVVAVEASAFPRRRLPLYIVEFQRVHRMEIGFSHYGVQIESGHFQWNVYGAEIDGAVGSLRIRLSSSNHLPVAHIECEAVDIRPLENELLDKRFPGWNRPGSPFIRPGVEELAKEDVRRP
jgi:hypothetical protein